MGSSYISLVVTSDIFTRRSQSLASNIPVEGTTISGIYASYAGVDVCKLQHMLLIS